MKQFWFIGVTTGQSMIMRLFPIWAEVLGIQGTRMYGVDLPPGAEGQKIRETVQELRANSDDLGALVTTHKLALWEEASDLFAKVDEHATRLQEISCISKDKYGKLIGHAKIRLLPARRWNLSWERIIGRPILKPRQWFWAAVVQERLSSNSCFTVKKVMSPKKSLDWNTTEAG